MQKREAEAGLPGGSRDLLSLQGGHAGNDTSAHLHYIKDCGRMQGGKTLVCSSGFSSKGGCRFARVLPRGGVQTPPSLLFLGKILSKTCVSLARRHELHTKRSESERKYYLRGGRMHYPLNESCRRIEKNR